MTAKFTISPIHHDAGVRDSFLDELRATGSVKAAAARIGVPRSTLYNTRRRRPDFAAAWDAIVGAEAGGADTDLLEAAIVERAMNGVPRSRKIGKEVVEEWREYSDALAIFLLKARRPQVYDAVGKGGSGGAKPGAAGKPPMDAAEFLSAVATMRRTAELERETPSTL